MAIARGQITLVDINEVVVGSTPPSVKVANETIWLDTSVDPPMLKVWDGSKWKEANDYEIGGVNILPNSNFENSDNPDDGFQWLVNKSSGCTVEVVDVTGDKIGFKNALHCKTVNKGSSGIRYNIWPRYDKNLSGKKFVLSGFIKYSNVVQGTYSYNKLQVGKLSINYTNSFGSEYAATIRDNAITGSSDWIKFEYPFELPSSYASVKGDIHFSLDSCNGEFWITGLKLEEGQKATAWTPRFDDSIKYTEQQILKTKAEVKVTTDSISQNVSSLSSKVSEVENTATGITEKIEEIETKQTNLDTTVNGISASVSTIESAISGNLVSNGSFENNTLGWEKTSGTNISRSTYSGKAWANIYSGNTGDKYAYIEVDTVNGKNHLFSIKVAYYSNSNKFYRIRLEYFNESIGAWVVDQDFTGETEGTRVKPHTINANFTALSSRYRVWVGKLATDPVEFDIYVTDVIVQCNHDVAKRSDLTILDDKIATKVDVDGVKSTIEQSPNSVMMGFNEISDVVYIDKTGMKLRGIFEAKINETLYARLQPIEKNGEVQFRMTLSGKGLDSNFNIIDATNKELFRVGHGGIGLHNNVTFTTDDIGLYAGMCYWENGTYYPANDWKNIIGKNSNAFYKVFGYKFGLDRTGAERYADFEAPIFRLISSWGYGGIAGDMQGYFHPEQNNAWSFGKSDKRISTVYCTHLNQPSDLNLKENVRYLLRNNARVINDEDTTNITIDDCYNFVKDDLHLAQFNYKNTKEDEKVNTIGFIAQDIEESNEKISQALLKKDSNGILNYDQSTYIGILTASLQKAIDEIETLKNRISELEGK